MYHKDTHQGQNRPKWSTMLRSLYTEDKPGLLERDRDVLFASVPKLISKSVHIFQQCYKLVLYQQMHFSKIL